MGRVFFAGGKVGMKKPAALPSGYTGLAYIECSGAQYVDSGFTPDSNSRMVLDFALTETGVNNSLIGARQSTSAKAFHFGAYNGYWRAGYNTTTTVTSVAEDTNRHTADFNQNVLSLDGTVIYTATAATFTGYASIYIGAIHASGTGYVGYAKIYGCQLYDNGALVRDFAPCIDPDGNIGLYDLVNSTFYGNAGSGSFVGSEVA